MSTGVNPHLERETVTSSAQAFTAAWVDLGSEISMLGYNKMCLWLKLDINDTNNPRIRAIAKLEKGGADEYIMQIKTVAASDVKIEDSYYEWNVDADENSVLQVDTDGLIPFVQLQIQAGTVGASAGEIDACEVTKKLD